MPNLCPCDANQGRSDRYAKAILFQGSLYAHTEAQRILIKRLVAAG